MDKSLADFALRYIEKRGASYVEAKLESHETNELFLKNSIPEAISFLTTQGLGIRYIADGTLGFISTNCPEKNRLKTIIDKSLNLTKRSSKYREGIKLSEEKIHKKSYKIKQKINLRDISPEEKLKELVEADKAILSTKVKTPGRYISLTDKLVKKYLITSDGTEIQSEIPYVNLHYFLTITEKNKSSQRQWQYGNTAGWEAVKKWNIPKILKDEALVMKNNLTKGKVPPKGVLDVIVGPQISGIMVHESVGHPYEADRIFGREAAQAGESFITGDMIGKRIGSEIITVIDDPTVESSFGFYLYDDEGIGARKKILIKKGIINEFLHNRETAYKMGIKSNASARAENYSKEAIVRMSNSLLAPGDYTEEELIEDIKLGIFMKNFTEWNIDDKRFQQKYVGLDAYLIKNGKIMYPIIKPTLEITTPYLWNSIDAIGKNFEGHAAFCGKGEPMQAVPVWCGGASARLRNIRLN